MKVQSPTTAAAMLLGVTIVSAPAFAQTTQKPSPAPSIAAPVPQDPSPATIAPLPSQPEFLFGDWGGFRTRAKDAGIKLSLGWVNEAAYNPRGGSDHKIASAGQFSFAAEADLGKLIAPHAGTIVVKLSQRYGQSLTLNANLENVQQVQEIYGRGNIARLSELSYSNTILGGRVNLKFGRLDMGDDFAAFSCKFQNLTFCYLTPDHIAGDNFFAYPVSMWAARARIKLFGDVSAKIGIYDINPRLASTTHGFSFDTSHSIGSNTIGELVWSPSLGSKKLRGLYKIGGWYSTANRDDLFYDVDRQPLTVTGAAPLQRRHYTGFYAMMQQQLTQDSSQADRGLSIFANYLRTDRNVVKAYEVINAGLFYTGFLPARPQDEIGFAIGRSKLSPLLRDGQRLVGAPTGLQHAEYPMELYYSLNFGSAVAIRPNVQLVVDPGGYPDRRNLVVTGLKTVVQF